jgi:hypothetical protein
MIFPFLFPQPTSLDEDKLIYVESLAGEGDNVSSTMGWYAINFGI